MEDGNEDEPFLPHSQRPQRQELNPALQLRVNVALAAMRNLYGCSGLIWNIPRLVAVGVMLILFVHPSCDVDLPLWLRVEGGRVVISLMASCAILIRPDYKFRRFWNLMWLAHLGWFILGFYWLMSSKTCRHTTAPLYYVVLGLLVLDFIYFFQICLACIIFIPLLCCCLPALLRRIPRNPDRGAAANAIATLPLKKYKPGSAGTETCAICLEQFVANDTVRTLPCDERHFFHQACIDDWLPINASCPICRARTFGSSSRSASRASSAQDERRVHFEAKESEWSTENSGQFHDEVSLDGADIVDEGGDLP